MAAVEGPFCFAVADDEDAGGGHSGEGEGFRTKDGGEGGEISQEGR